MPVLSALAHSIPRNNTQALASFTSAVLASAPDPHCNSSDATLGHCRTIWNIVWSCLITIFACIWVAIHPNVPQPRESFEGLDFGEKPKEKTWGAWARFQRHCARVRLLDIFWRQIPQIVTSLADKLFIAVLALLAPEFIFVWALRQWLRARSLAEECREADTNNRGNKFQRELWEQRGLFQRLDALKGHDPQQHENYEYLRNRLSQSNAAFPAHGILEASDMNAEWKAEGYLWDPDRTAKFVKVMDEPSDNEKSGPQAAASGPVDETNEMVRVPRNVMPTSDKVFSKTAEATATVVPASSKMS